MIVVLHGEANEKAGEEIATYLRTAFKMNVEISLTNASKPVPWPAGVDWDDLLIVAYDEASFPEAGNEYITAYLEARLGNGLLLPVALNLAHRRPPKAAAAFKALVFDSAAGGVDGRLVRRAGAMLGLIAQQRGSKVFISYRATDGTAIAEQLESYLVGLGYPVWRDEAPEIDGETKILPGSEVQSQIDEGLQQANIVLLLDFIVDRI